jgi:hypothetical protein
MIVGRGDICVRQPCCRGSCIDMSATVYTGRSLIESNYKKRMVPIRAGGHQRHERLKKGIALSGRTVVHIIGHIRDHHGKVDGRIKIREGLNVGALDRIEANAFKTNHRIVFSDVLPGQTRTVDTARAGVAVKARAGVILGIDAP